MRSLFGEGTDHSVTQIAASGTGGPFQFGGAASNRGQPEHCFTQDRLTSPGGLVTLTSANVGSVSRLRGVAVAAGVINRTRSTSPGPWEAVDQAWPWLRD